MSHLDDNDKEDCDGDSDNSATWVGSWLPWRSAVPSPFGLHLSRDVVRETRGTVSYLRSDWWLKTSVVSWMVARQQGILGKVVPDKTTLDRIALFFTKTVSLKLGQQGDNVATWIWGLLTAERQNIRLLFLQFSACFDFRSDQLGAWALMKIHIGDFRFPICCRG